MNWTFCCIPLLNSSIFSSTNFAFQTFQTNRSIVFLHQLCLSLLVVQDKDLIANRHFFCIVLVLQGKYPMRSTCLGFNFSPFKSISPVSGPVIWLMILIKDVLPAPLGQAIQKPISRQRSKKYHLVQRGCCIFLKHVLFEEYLPLYKISKIKKDYSSFSVTTPLTTNFMVSAASASNG